MINSMNMLDLLKISGQLSGPGQFAQGVKEGNVAKSGLLGGKLLHKLLKINKDEENKDENKDDKKKKLSTADKLSHGADALKSFASVMDPETMATSGIRYQSWV